MKCSSLLEQIKSGRLCQVAAAPSYLLSAMGADGTDAPPPHARPPPLNSLTSPGSGTCGHTSRPRRRTPEWANAGVPSESHLSLKATPDLSAVCRGLHCEGHRQGNGGRTCQPGLCARNTYELYRKDVSSRVRYQRSPVTAVF